MSELICEVDRLSRQFSGKVALDEVSLQVSPGKVYGLLGTNGAGKTTLIKHLLGLLRAQKGSVRVLGLDPVQHPVEVLSRVGYLSEERDLPDWLTIDELLRYSAAYYPAWDHHYAQELMTTFALDPKKRIKHLSKGMRAQVGLIAAVCHHPDLLLLDEPSTGLDAIVRRDILNAIIREVADSGRTAIFSSHLLDEVERMSDHVWMISNGQFVLDDPLDEILEKHTKLSIQHASQPESIPDFHGQLSAEKLGEDWDVILKTDGNNSIADISSSGWSISHRRNATLQEIFIAQVGSTQILEVSQ